MASSSKKYEAKVAPSAKKILEQKAAAEEEIKSLKAELKKKAGSPVESEFRKYNLSFIIVPCSDQRLTPILLIRTCSYRPTTQRRVIGEPE